MTATETVVVVPYRVTVVDVDSLLWERPADEASFWPFSLGRPRLVPRWR